MTALPMLLQDALRYQGFELRIENQPAFDITLTEGIFHVPEATRTVLHWARDGQPELGADLYLSNIPIFDDAYRPVLISHILDRYRTRRLGYNTPGEFMLAFRRWCNLNMTIPNQRYRSTAVQLPLDDRDETETVAATRHGLDVASDFPQSLISGTTDYASAATDRRTADNTTVTRTGRNVSTMRLLEEQRGAYINVDIEILDQMDDLFLSTLDRLEGEPAAQYGLPHRLQRLDWQNW